MFFILICVICVNLRINLFLGISNDIGDTSLKPVELGAAAALADGRYRQKPNRSHRHTPMNALSLSFGYPPVGARDSIRLSDSTAGGLDDGVLSVESGCKHEESNAGQD